MTPDAGKLDRRTSAMCHVRTALSVIDPSLLPVCVHGMSCRSVYLTLGYRWLLSMNIWRPAYSPWRFEPTAHLWHLWLLCAAYKCTYFLTCLLTYLLSYVGTRRRYIFFFYTVSVCTYPNVMHSIRYITPLAIHHHRQFFPTSYSYIVHSLFHCSHSSSSISLSWPCLATSYHPYILFVVVFAPMANIVPLDQLQLVW